MQSIIHLENIRKSYYLGKHELQVLKGISLDIFKNEYVALMGPSGSEVNVATGKGVIVRFMVSLLAQAVNGFITST